MEQTPTIGRIVHFYPSESAALAVNAVSGGNSIRPGAPLAAVIVRVWSPTCVNLKVITDGPTDAWLTSVTYSADPAYTNSRGNSCWTWPPRT